MARTVIAEATYCYNSGRKLTPAIIQCDCEAPLELSRSWANSCECGAEYNGSGQQLAPRSQWGEETGEHSSDFNDMGDL